MGLPKGVHGARKVELSGGEVEIHSLTLEQSRIAGNQEDAVERVVCGIAFATRTDPQEVREWISTSPAGDATKLMNAIAEVSGLTEGAQFPQ